MKSPNLTELQVVPAPLSAGTVLGGLRDPAGAAGRPALDKCWVVGMKSSVGDLGSSRLARMEWVRVQCGEVSWGGPCRNTRNNAH